MLQNQAKIISLVPSWTETLLECGVNVVARTRFCIHPAQRVQNIPVVGGTKNLKIEEIIKLQPDFVILDQEENKKEMADELQRHGIEMIVSHVTSLQSAAQFLAELALRLKNEDLQILADRYQRLIESKKRLSSELFFQNSLIQSLGHQNAVIDQENLCYVIWKDPYMVIGEETFISDVFSMLKLRLHAPDAKYPQMEESELKKYFCLFSSEPYPFEKEFAALSRQGFKSALIDGEKISWYGIRNIKFLESCLAEPQ